MIPILVFPTQVIFQNNLKQLWEADHASIVAASHKEISTY